MMMRRRIVPSSYHLGGVMMRLILLLLMMTCYVQQHQLFISAFILPPSLVSRKTHQPTSSSCSGNVVINFDPATKRKTSAKLLSSSIIKASPSGIDEWPLISQTLVFFGAYVALASASYPTIKLLETFSQFVVGLERWRIYVIDSTLPILMGLVYLLGGIGHFVAAESFQDIYPPIGTWGIWYLPGSAAFHVAWTGVVELLGGAGLIFSGIRDAIGSEDGEEENNMLLINFLKPICASVLFVLTIMVTPANIYMFTHGAVMGDMAPLDVSFHYIRFAVQVTFLTLLFTLARDSFFYAWGDELD
jgi:uncharacterized membrane protein